MKFHYPIVSLILLLAACGTDPKIEEKTIENSPESVARAWQHYMDINQFDKAKALSTPRTVAFIEALEQLVWSDTEPPLSDTTIFLSMLCNEIADSATCHFAFELDGEILRDSFKLVRINGNWLFDIQDDPLGSDGEEMEEMMDFLNEE